MSLINSNPKRKNYSDHSSYSYSGMGPKECVQNASESDPHSCERGLLTQAYWYGLKNLNYILAIWKHPGFSVWKQWRRCYLWRSWSCVTQSYVFLFASNLQVLHWSKFLCMFPKTVCLQVHTRFIMLYFHKLITYCLSDVVGIDSSINFHLSQLSNAKFSILYDISLVRDWKRKSWLITPGSERVKQYL